MRGSAWAAGAFGMLACAAVVALRAPSPTLAPPGDDDVADPTDSPPAEAPPPEPRSAPAFSPAATDDPWDAPLESLTLRRPTWPPPRDAELDSARPVTLAYQSAADAEGNRITPCIAREARGWLRVRCEIWQASASLLGGSALAVAIDATPTSIAITMPMTPGDRRVLQLARLGAAYWERGLVAVGTLQEVWIGTRGPHVTLNAAAMPR